MVWANAVQHKWRNSASGSAAIRDFWDQLPDDPGSKFKSKPNFGKALSVMVNRRPYSFTPELSRMTPPNEATQLVRSR